MPLDGRFPHFPGRAWGFLYGRGASTVVLWADDHTVGEWPEGSSTPEDLDAFGQLLDAIGEENRPRNMAEAHDAILSAGWEDRGSLKYEVQSGLLLVDAVALADLAEELWHEREEILARFDDRHPEIGSADWPVWITVTARRNAAVRGARALALAAVESLVNELLAAQHPDEYGVWETKKRMGFSKKLANLLKLHSEDPDEVAWFTALNRHVEMRNAMIHHRPGWVVDESEEHSVEPSEDMTQERLAETLEVVHGAVEGLFALYGVPTPETHRPDWLRDAKDW